MTNSSPTLNDLSQALADGKITSRTLAEACLERIQDKDGEGSRTFLQVDADKVRQTADAMDKLRAANAAPSRFAGIPISVKDLFDVQGDVTRAGSRALADSPSAARDATVIARVRQAGFVIIGRTNMTEFAYSGLGINPHYGTPANPWQRATPRVPGGSSSGAAISVSDGMAHAALGTDTGGSCRIPAAFAGIVGYKPTARLIPQDGIVPLAPSLDAAGPLARSVGCCASVHALLSGQPEIELSRLDLSGLRFAIPQTFALDDLDKPVARAFEAAIDRLSRAGARIVNVPFESFRRIPPMNAKGGFAAMESYAWHRALIDKKRAVYDPRVVNRIVKGADGTAVDYLELLAARKALIAAADAELAPFDALLMPTVAIVPPRIADLAGDEAYSRANILSLRNTSLINATDGCAISLPIHEPDDAPVGLMLAGRGGDDQRLLALAAAVETALAVA
nr:amidase [Bradyrhizobium prioritasuperba]